MRALILVAVLLVVALPAVSVPVSAGPPDVPVRACSSLVDDDCPRLLCYTAGEHGPVVCTNK